MAKLALSRGSPAGEKKWKTDIGEGERIFLPAMRRVRPLLFADGGASLRRGYVSGTCLHIAAKGSPHIDSGRGIGFGKKPAAGHAFCQGSRVVALYTTNERLTSRENRNQIFGRVPRRESRESVNFAFSRADLPRLRFVRLSSARGKLSRVQIIFVGESSAISHITSNADPFRADAMRTWRMFAGKGSIPRAPRNSKFRSGIDSCHGPFVLGFRF